jgi:hypothetical protein
MVCASVKEGIECFFMNKDGCQFNGGSCHQIIEECEGCLKVKEFPTGKYCLSFPEPAVKWRIGICNMATHVKASNGKASDKINPLKASKRGSH